MPPSGRRTGPRNRRLLRRRPHPPHGLERPPLRPPQELVAAVFRHVRRRDGADPGRGGRGEPGGGYLRRPGHGIRGGMCDPCGDPGRERGDGVQRLSEGEPVSDAQRRERGVRHGGGRAGRSGGGGVRGGAGGGRRGDGGSGGADSLRWSSAFLRRAGGGRERSDGGTGGRGEGSGDGSLRVERMRRGRRDGDLGRDRRRCPESVGQDQEQAG
mmetsp:Transcript_4691/g.9212  ORF Transcript_4691/g.9212 Transcript_4691/m.9212 type:complete len:213 (-) Transcript_4691:2531-3169(-)